MSGLQQEIFCSKETTRYIISSEPPIYHTSWLQQRSYIIDSHTESLASGRTEDSEVLQAPGPSILPQICGPRPNPEHGARPRPDLRLSSSPSLRPSRQTSPWRWICRWRPLSARMTGSRLNKRIGRMRTERNPKATLFGGKRNLGILSIQVQNSIPLTVGHRGHWR
jgi:hypothetical protein